MKYTWLAASFLSLALLCPWPSMAQEVLNLRGIGKMNVPQKITFQKGQQEALPFMADGGAKKYFLRKGLTEDTFYTMTYSNPPDYTYGWALSQKLVKLPIKMILLKRRWISLPITSISRSWM